MGDFYGCRNGAGMMPEWCLQTGAGPAPAVRVTPGAGPAPFFPLGSDVGINIFQFVAQFLQSS